MNTIHKPGQPSQVPYRTLCRIRPIGRPVPPPPDLRERLNRAVELMLLHEPWRLRRLLGRARIERERDGQA